MTSEQRDLLIQAKQSLSAAKLLHDEGYPGYAASRAYYAMFYIAEAFLLGRGLAFSKHAAVHAAFGEHFAKTGIIPTEYHRYLIHAMGIRHAGDYGGANSVTPEESAIQADRAQQFLDLAERLIAPVPDETGKDETG